METGPGLGWAGAGRGMKGGLTWALVGGSSLRLSGPGPDSLAAPAAGAGSGSGSGAIYGAWMGRVQSPSAVILEPRKRKSDTVSTVSPSISHEVMGPDAMIFIF